MKASNQKSTLPNLVTIGAMKSGTTSLHNYLKLHPQIFMSELKETDFFVEEFNWSKGLDWYKSNFKQEADIVGESCTNYSKYPYFKGVPERMHRIIPEAKLIYILRDPIKRIASHYIHRVWEGWENRSIDEALTDLKGNHYVNCSSYYMQIERYLPYYQPSNILVITLEDLAGDRANTLSKIFRFLNVDPNFKHEDFSVVAHQSSQKKQPTPLRRRLVAIPGGRLVESAMFRLLGGPKASQLLWRPIDRPIISESIRQALVDVLQKDVQKLRDFTGYSFADWSL
jgi:hypothetical protein